MSTGAAFIYPGSRWVIGAIAAVGIVVVGIVFLRMDDSDERDAQREIAKQDADDGVAGCHIAFTSKFEGNAPPALVKWPFKHPPCVGIDSTDYTDVPAARPTKAEIAGSGE